MVTFSNVKNNKEINYLIESSQKAIGCPWIYRAFNEAH